MKNLKKNLFVRRPGLTSTVAVVLAMAGALAVSLAFYLHASIRLDESQSLWQTSRTLRGTIQTVARDVHVPGYHIILHYWQILFGQSIEAARALSLAFFMVSIPLFWLLARQVLARKWSVLALAAYAFSPFMLWYANEARMYTMLVTVAILSQYFYVRILQRKSGWVGYALTAMVGIYVHYFFLFTLFAQAVYFLFNRRSFARRSFLKFAALASVLAVEFAPWLYFFHKLGSGSGMSPNLTKPSTVDFFNAMSQFAFGFQTDAVNTVLLSAWPILMAGALLFIRNKVSIPKTVGYLMYAGLVPIVAAFAVSVTLRPFFISRYMVASLPALLIVLVWIIGTYPKLVRRILVGAVVAVIALTSLLQVASPMTPVKEDYRAAASQIASQAGPSDVVVLSTPFTLYPFEYNYGVSPAAVMTLPDWNGRAVNGIPGFDKNTLPAQVKALADGHRRAYVLLSYDQGYESTIKRYFETHYTTLSKHEYSHDLTLYVYDLGTKQVPDLSALPDDMKITAQAE